MEIIQQKLAWALAMTAMLTLVYKLDLRRTGIGRSAIKKVKAGFILNLAGALTGVVIRIGFTSDSLPHPTLAVLIETLGGYLLGWTILIWGLIQGLGSFFDPNGDLKSDPAVGKLSKNLSSSLLNGSGPNRIMEELGGDLLKILVADAITLHRVDEAGQLRLSYSVGLDPASRNLIRMPEGTGNIYLACIASGRPVTADNPFEITLGKRLELSKGLARTALCLPAVFSGKNYGLVTIYRTEGKVFHDEDCGILRIAGDGLGLALWQQCNDDAVRMRARYKEIVSLARRYFVAEKSLVSAMIKTAKLIHGQIPFEKIKLDIMGDGKPNSLDFNLSTGGIVSFGKGYFSKEEYPGFHLDSASSAEFKRISDDVLYDARENAYMFPVCIANNQAAALTIKVPSTTRDSKGLSELGTALCHDIAGFLRREKQAALTDKTGQRLGAIRFLAETAESGGDLTQFLYNATSAVVDLMPATICRIVFVDGDQKFLRSAGVAEARDLKWPDSDDSGVRVDDVEICRKALDSGGIVNFDCHIDDSGQLARGYSRLVPPVIRRGMCLPLRIEPRTVGLLVVGDARRTIRSETAAEDAIFVSAVAGMISMVLTLHKEKSRQSLPGNKMGRLTLRKKGTHQETSVETASLSDRSRINGPLAGILASCEYLQSCPPEDFSEIGRFIDIIQRNAARIQAVTSETNRP